MENKELIFARTLEEVKKLAKEQGNFIEKAKVRELFAVQDLDESQYDLIFDYLKKHKIGVDEAIDVDDYLTGEEKDYLKEYLAALSEQGEYSQAIKEDLLRAAMDNDEAAAKRLTEVYLKDVTQVAKLYTGQGVLFEDLIGEGNVALAVSVRELGGLKTVKKAEAHLICRIMAAMEDLIKETAHNRDSDTKMVEKLNVIAEDAKELAEALGRRVTVEELAGEGVHSVKEIIEAIKLAGINELDVKE